jgi:phenylpropionate dioxygenase-like ring-hydroxylating dioxygenase large terminal subunit
MGEIKNPLHSCFLLLASILVLLTKTPAHGFTSTIRSTGTPALQELLLNQNAGSKQQSEAAVAFTHKTAISAVSRNAADNPSDAIVTTTSKKDKRPFAKFDYEDHWYPCIWAEDLVLDEPTKVTIFDVDYVVAKTSNGEVIAMKDYCTHKGAALSQGRVTASGNFQCAYHGWSFDGKTGACVEIPQIVKRDKGALETSATIPLRACSTAVPAQIHQGMVWLFPGGGLEKALVAPPPPSVPSEFYDNFKTSTVIRDMPVDWPILLSNICDPDHGLFAHQTKGFDLYTASLDVPFESFADEETDDGKGYSIKAKIESKDKLLVVDKSLREHLDPKLKKKSKKREKKPSSTDDDASTSWATTHVQAPSYVRLNRVDKESGETKFVSVFYVCPVGVGRSRFMSASISGVKTPRWLSNFFVANFVDQDTYLLATQQKNLLAMEADDLRDLMEEEGISRNDMKKVKDLQLRTRRDNFCLPSPSDRIGAKLERFWDATLPRSPNRVKNLLKLDESGAFLETPSREFVLDRQTQHLDISKDSQDVVRNCRSVRKATKVLGITQSFAKLCSSTAEPSTFIEPFLKSLSLLTSFGLLSVTLYLASKLEKEYYFNYTDSMMRRKDMKKIPKQI